MQYNKSPEFKKEQLQKAKNYALSMDGQCLSNEYINLYEKLEWKCSNPNHPHWFSSYANVIASSVWCSVCTKEKNKICKNKKGLKLAYEHAKSKGGECLSTEYINAITKMEWKCHNKNHYSWYAKYNNVVKIGTWCPECGKNRNIQENRVRNILNEIFQTKFISSKISWNINPETGKMLELDGYCDNLKIAFEYQGEQHFLISNINSKKDLEYLQRKDKYKKANCENHNVKLIIINYIKNGNKFEELLKEIKRAILHCGINQKLIYNNKKLKVAFNIQNENSVQEKQLKKAKEYAKSRSGECLSTYYINYDTPLEWKCNNSNHKLWESTYDTVVNGQKWCPECTREHNSEKQKNPNGLILAQNHAINKGGKCLSTEYKNTKTKLQWKCENINHKKFDKSFDHVIRRNQWCPECYKERKIINKE